jgi:ATP adenylyltransferase
VAEPLRDQLLQLCRQRLDAFRMQRGEEVGCLLTQKPAASGTGTATARRSAARSKSGCSPAPRAAANAAGQAVAWQTPHQRALEVDHIIPKNQGGTGDLSNLQELCFRCNAGKRWEARASPQYGERIAERMLGAAEHVRNSVLGSGQRTNRD